MQHKRLAKKLVAIGTGALMLGATMGAALAQSYDLGDFPGPFVDNGVLSNTVIVVGATAKTSDVLGAVDIAAALQAAAVSQTELDVGEAVAPTIDEGVKIEKSGDKFHFGNDIYDIQPQPLDDNDLPDLLGDGTFDDREGTNKGDEDYDQELQFEDSVGTLKLTQPDDMPGGVYFVIDKNDRVYNYTFEFDAPVDYSTSATGDDMEGNTIEIQGRVYTITEASESSGVLDKLKLVGGDSVVWLVQDQPYQVGAHTVTVVDVDAGETKCGVNVDGSTIWIDDGATEEFGDLSVGVLDVVAVYTENYDADTCELSLGSSELELEDGDKVKVNGEELEGSIVDLTGTAGSWTGFTIRYQAGKEDDGVNSDDVNLEPGQAWSDPVFGNFKVVYEGTTAKYEDLEFDVSGDDATLTFMNNDGVEVEVPFNVPNTNTGTIILGTDSDEPMLLPGESYSGDPEGVLLWYVTSSNEAHVLEITDVTCSSSNNKTSIDDVTYNTNVAKDEELTQDCQLSQTPTTISLGSLGSITLNMTASYVEYVNNSFVGYPAETKYEHIVTFTNDSIFIQEDEDDDATLDGTFSFTLDWDSSDDEINVNAPSGTNEGPVDNDEGDDDTTWYRTNKGTLIKYDAEDQLFVEVMLPEDDVFANVFVAPIAASVTAGSSGGSVVADKVNPFSVGLAVLDEDAGSMSKNMVVVGGPCVNDIARELMGNPANCAADFEAGKAMIKYFSRNGRAALLVAGYEAQDTLGASYVLADYEDYDLSGDEVEVVVTSLDQISVSTV